MNIHKTITLSLVGITTCCGLVLTSVRSYADGDSVVSNASVTVPVSCIMSSSVDTAHNATLSPGTYSGASGSQYENGIGKTTLTTFCNDNNGFSIYAIGFTGDSYDGGNHTKLVGTTVSGNATIATKVYESSDTTSNWSMKVTKVENPSGGDPITYSPQNMTITNSFNSWHTIPDTYTKVAEYHATTGSSTTDTALGAKVETTYASYIAPTQAADTYTGKVKYVMVHPYDHTTPTVPDSNACTTPVPNLTYMQDLNSSNKTTVLASMAEDAQYFLKDKRDEKSYCVSKLKDGNIWMTQNLDHDIVTTPNYYTNENTDIGWNGGSYDTTTWTANYATLTSGEPVNDADYDYEPQSYNLGDIYVDSDYIDSWVVYFQSCDTGTLDNCDDSLRPADDSSNPVLTGNQHYHVGNYYNWSAAVALNNTNAYRYGDVDVNRSICPANWTLPKDKNITSSGSISYLLNQYGYNVNNNMLGNGYISFASPLYLNLAGLYNLYDDNHNFLGSIGYYWASSADTGYSANGFAAFIDGVNREDYYLDGTIAYHSGYRSNLLSIRCVSR